MNEVYIIGGGTSLAGFDFHKLRDLDTIAVNMSALDVPDPTYCMTADSGIFRKLQKGVFKSVDTTWVLVTNPNHASMKWKDGKFVHTSGFVYNLLVPNMVIRNAGTEGIGFTFKDFRTGYNSGFCAFQLAVLLGYKKINLLGFDLTSKNGVTHYHDRYHGRKIADNTLEKFYNNFVLALQTIKQQTDIEVVSCSSISWLNKVISYVPFKLPLYSQNKASQTAQEPLNNLIGVYTPIKGVTAPTGVLGRIRLSILICSIIGREKKLNELIEILNRQRTNDIEVLVYTDNKQITTGEKRNKLLQAAKGDYITFIDDDDLIAKEYVSKILNAIKSDPDCCGMEGLVTFRSKSKQNLFKHSISFKSWYKENEVYYRSPNHLNPVKRVLALQAGFPLISVREDKEYSKRLLSLLKTEVYIKDPIYFYLTG